MADLLDEMQGSVSTKIGANVRAVGGDLLDEAGFKSGDSSLISEKLSKQQLDDNLNSLLDEINADLSTFERFAVGAGRGMTMLARGAGLAEPESEVTTRAFNRLSDDSMAATIGEIVGEAAPFLAAAPLAGAGLATGAGRVIIPQAAKLGGKIAGSAALGATEGGLITKGRGGDVGQTSIGAATGGVLAGSIEALMPVIGRLGSKVFQRLGRTPKGPLLTPDGSPTPELQQALAETGTSFDDLASEAFTVVNQQGVDPTQAARAARMSSQGIPATAGDITQDFAQQAKEQRLISMASGESGEPLRQVNLQKSEAFKSRVDELVESLGVPDEAGDSIKAALKGRKKLLQAEKNALYKEVAESTAPTLPVDVARSTVRGENIVNFTSPSGKLSVGVSGDTAQIGGAMIRDASKRGKGEGTKLYAEAARRLKRDGVNSLLSDNTVEAPAAKVWEKLGKQGFPVKKSADARLIKDSRGDFFTVDGDGPVFTMDLAGDLPEPPSIGSIPLMTDSIADSMISSKEIRRLSRLALGPVEATKDLLVEFGIDNSDEAIESFADEITPLSLGNFEDFRQAINLIERSDTTGAVKVFTGPIKIALDAEAEIVDGAIKQVDGLDSAVLDTIKQARQRVRQIKTEFSPQSITGRMIDVKRDGVTPVVEASKAARELLKPGAPIENLQRTLSSLSKSGDKGVKAIKDMQASVVLNALEDALKAPSRKTSGIETIGGNQFAKSLSKFGDDKLELLFKGNPKALSRLQNLKQTALDISPASAATPKGSAPVILDIMKKAGSLPGLAAIRDSIEFVLKAGSDDRAVRKAMNARPAFKRAISSLESDFPAIASALGVAAIAPQVKERDR